MAKKTNYTALDDVEFIGVEAELSDGERSRQAKETAAFIRNFQAESLRNGCSTSRPRVRGRARKTTITSKATSVIRKRTPSKATNRVK